MPTLDIESTLGRDHSSAFLGNAFASSKEFALEPKGNAEDPTRRERLIQMLIVSWEDLTRRNNTGALKFKELVCTLITS